MPHPERSMVKDAVDLFRAMHLLRLINSEFQSDPMSVQCFDLKAIVRPTKELVQSFYERHPDI